MTAIELEERLRGVRAVGFRYGNRAQRCGAKVALQGGAQGLRQVVHGVEGRGSAAEPAPDLLAPIGRHLLLGKPAFQLGGRERKDGRTRLIAIRGLLDVCQLVDTAIRALLVESDLNVLPTGHRATVP